MLGQRNMAKCNELRHSYVTLEQEHGKAVGSFLNVTVVCSVRSNH
jgi:hypothetical protein